MSDFSFPMMGQPFGARAAYGSNGRAAAAQVKEAKEVTAIETPRPQYVVPRPI
jgi:hypothetical protein